MKIYIRFRDWPLRLKMGVFFIGVAALPLLSVTLIEFASQRQQIIEQVSSLLTARVEEVTSALDVLNQGYLRSTAQLAGLPEIHRYAQESALGRRRAAPEITTILLGWKELDRNLWWAGVIDSSGTVIAATGQQLAGHSLTIHGYAQEVLRGSPVISDFHYVSLPAGSVPMVAYATPIKDSTGRVLGAAVLWVRASALWNILKERNEKAGEKSFSVMFDRFGVRVGHSYSEDIVFHPGGKLEQAVVDAMVAERRFGEKTRELLDAPREFPEQFNLSRMPSPDSKVFRGFAPVNQLWNYGVARRLQTVHWTLFYMIPERSLDAPIRALTERLILVGVAIILIALGVGIVIARAILKPITAVAMAAEALGKGDLSARSPVSAGDEIGQLSVVFNATAERLEAMVEAEKQMHEHLQKTVSEYTSFAKQVGSGDLTVHLETDADSMVGRLGLELNNMVGNLRELAARLTESASILHAAAGEIFSTTTQVVSGSSETATAIGQTTATVEEVKQTAQMASQKAKYVSESAQKAAQVSQSGRKSVDEVAQGMHRIQEQMESIAESIVRLSEQSQAIGEIIATVNNLAEQSNLLAVNAAIEATKAGEQGKGFVVVAQEIKSLAEQSKQATAQVRAILSDIQKATSAAVLATEQGDKAVEAGVKQSVEAGESIRILAESIAEAAQAATQIAASSQQQMVGMDQVALAMENIKQASMQNVSGTKQAETAAQSLQELGQKLRQLVERYRI